MKTLKKSLGRNIINNKTKKRKIYRKKRKTFKLRGGTQLRNTLQGKSSVLHPLNAFVTRKMDSNYLIQLDKNNIETMDYGDIYTKAFFDKYLEILNFSFEKERNYFYPSDYRHNIDSIKSNIHNPRFETLILTSFNLTPISFLYIEKNKSDYDKIWTVCTDRDYRGKGMSSKLLQSMIVKQLNDNRRKMLLEVFNDQVISREENDVKQEQIMGHFGKNGFEHTPLNELEPDTFQNLLSNDGRTKVMIFNPRKWYQSNTDEARNLNSKGREICVSK